MKWKGIILLFIAILLFLFIFFYEKNLPTTEEMLEKEKKIFNLKEEQFILLSYKSKDLNWEVKKEEDKWKITKPIEYSADEFTINNIIKAIVELEKEKEIKEINLKDFELEKPENILFFKTNKMSEEILIGALIPQINKMAIRIKGTGKNYFISSIFLEKIKKNLNELRNKDIFSYQASDVSFIEIKTIKKTVNLEKKEKFWYLDFPFKDRAEKDGVEDLIYGLSSLKAKDFFDEPTEENLKELNLSPPIVTISFFDKDKKLILQGEFGKKEGLEKNDFYVKNGLRVFLSNSQIWEKLEKGLVAIPDTKILSFSSWEVKRFYFKIKDEFSFDKKDEKWFLNGKELKDEKPVNSILKEFSELKWLKSANLIDIKEEIADLKIEGENFQINCKFYKDKMGEFWAKPEDRPNYWSFVEAAWKRLEEELNKIKT